MEMRLGKTLTLIRYLTEKAKPPYLIVAPMTVVEVWKEELLRETETSIVCLLGTLEKRTWAFNLRADWNIINYEGLLAFPRITDRKWGAVVLDESTRIKNPKAKITKFLCSNFRYAPVRAIASGLPAPESRMDLFSQFKFLDDTFMGFNNFWMWREKLFYPAGFDWLPKKGTMERIKKEVNNRAFWATLKDAKMGNVHIYEKRFIHMTKEQKADYDRAETSFEMKVGDELKWTQWNPVMWLWLCRIAGGVYDGVKAEGKIKEVLNLLGGELRDKQIVIWFRFNAELKAVSEALQKAGIRSKKITGTTPVVKRALRVSSFNNRKYQALLVQIKCGKFGLNLSVASAAIYFSNSASLEERRQSEERIEHMTKKEPLLYIDLVAKGTVDEDLVKLLQEKDFEAKLLQNKLLEGFKKRRRNAELFGY